MHGRLALQARLARGAPLLGLLQMYPSRLTIEAAAATGYDFVMLDGEYGLYDETALRDGLAALRPLDILAFVRVGRQDRGLMEQALRLGADIVVAPQVSTADEARALVGWMAPNPDAGLIAIIETAAGVANAAAILAVGGVEGVIIGPNDLSADMGHPGAFDRPEHVQALSQVEQAAASTDRFVGCIVHGGYSRAALIARGHRLCIVGADKAILRNALAAQLTA